MSNFLLKSKLNHLFITIDGNEWLLDTGGSVSFGNVDTVQIEEQTFSIPRKYMGFDSETLSEWVQNRTVGIIGVDILTKFDIIIDLPKRIVTFSEERLNLDGEVLAIDDFMGIPIFEVATIGGEEYSMIFDTGAQVSYFQGPSLYDFTAMGAMEDFHPSIGKFQTETFLVNVKLGSKSFNLQTGSLEGPLGMSVTMTGAMGVIGNEILANSVVGFFPRRKRIVIS